MQSANNLHELGLVGLGKIARDQHVPALRNSAHFRLAATASPADQLDGIPGYDSLDRMLDQNPQIRAVVLCTPPGVRFDLARAALEAGRHVMLEKPPTISMDEAKALAALAQAKGCTLFSAWHSRETDCVDRARDWLVGKSIKRIMIEWREDIRRWHPGQDWILAADGFGVFDPGINALSILTTLCPAALELTHATLQVPSNHAAPIAARLTMQSGQTIPVLADFDFRNEAEQVWDIVFETDYGFLRLSDGGHGLSIDGTKLSNCPDAEYPRLYARFAGLIGMNASDCDVRPLGIVAAALAEGQIVVDAPFEL